MIYSRHSVFLFEAVHPYKWTNWMQTNWHYSIYATLAYVTTIYFGQRVMKHRKPFDLRKPLMIWNAMLALFSIIGLLRFGPRFLHNLLNYNYYYTVCINNYAYDVAGYWAHQFAHSKILELGDTMFILARKRPLIFLHWYHHVTVLVYTWHAYKDHTAAGQWFITMNYLVHAFMYSYYTLRAAGYKIPRSISMGITIMQITQMILGVHVTVSAYLFKLDGKFCQQTYDNIHFAFLIYFSYFCLFANFFYKAYVKGAAASLRNKTCLVISNPAESTEQTPNMSHEGQGDFIEKSMTNTEEESKLRYRIPNTNS